MIKPFRFLAIAAALTISVEVAAQTGPEFDPANYERVLLPAVAPSPIPGAFGSRWQTFVVVTNRSERDAWVTLGAPLCSTICAPGAFKVVAKQTRNIELYSNPTSFFPHGGLFLHVEKNRRSDVAVSERLVELSLKASPVGVEIPVIRTDREFPVPLQLIDIPLNSSSRAALRIYDLGTGPPGREVRVALFSTRTSQELMSFTASLTGLVDYRDGFPPYASSADYFDLRGLNEVLRNHDSIRVEITPVSPETRFWAFVTVTDNVTQYVRTITPQ